MSIIAFSALSIAEIRNEIGRFRTFSRIYHFFVRRSWATINDVIANRTV